MSTEQEQPNERGIIYEKNLGDVFAEMALRTQVTKTDESVAELESELQREKDGRREERFYMVALSSVLLDGIMFPHISAVGIIFIGAVQLVCLIGLARFLGVDTVVVLFERLLAQMRLPGSKP
jgi:hypothetical protein